MKEIAVTLTAGLLLWYWSMRPSNTRRWSADQVILPEPDIGEEKVHIRSIRNFSYQAEDKYTPHYYDKTFVLEQLRQVYFVFTPFKKSRHAAHAFLIFDFAKGESVAVSIEIRKKHNEKYSALKGLLKQYELMYVIADERDVIQLRTHCRQNDVYMYPLRIEPEARRTLFLDMMRRARKLVDEPEFYNTIRNACLINMAHHINAVMPGRVPFDIRLVVSGYADKYLYKLGLLDTSLPFEQTRKAYYISQRVRACRSDLEFAIAIRPGSDADRHVLFPGN